MLIGIALLISGALILLLNGFSWKKSETWIAEQEPKMQRSWEELGPLSGWSRGFWVWDKATYRHPVLMRLPGLLMTVAGLVLVLSDVLA